MAREMREYSAVIFAFESTGLPAAFREAADFLEERPGEYDTKGAYIQWIDGTYCIVLPVARVRPRL